MDSRSPNSDPSAVPPSAEVPPEKPGLEAAALDALFKQGGLQDHALSDKDYEQTELEVFVDGEPSSVRVIYFLYDSNYPKKSLRFTGTYILSFIADDHTEKAKYQTVSIQATPDSEGRSAHLSVFKREKGGLSAEDQRLDTEDLLYKLTLATIAEFGTKNPLDRSSSPHSRRPRWLAWLLPHKKAA